MLKPKKEVHSLEISREKGTCIYLLRTEVKCLMSLKGCYVLAFLWLYFVTKVSGKKRGDELLKNDPKMYFKILKSVESA